MYSLVARSLPRSRPRVGKAVERVCDRVPFLPAGLSGLRRSLLWMLPQRSSVPPLLHILYQSLLIRAAQTD